MASCHLGPGLRFEDKLPLVVAHVADFHERHADDAEQVRRVGREQVRLVAAEAWYDPVSRAWIFKDGRRLAFESDTGELVASVPFTRISAPNYAENPDIMLLIDRKPSLLLIGELRNLMAYLEREHSPKWVHYAVRYYGLVADTLAPLIVIAIAIPFAVTGVRVNPAVGVSKSLGLFFLYYILANVASTLATKGVVEPVVAAWLPNAGMTALAGAAGGLGFSMVIERE